RIVARAGALHGSALDDALGLQLILGSPHRGLCELALVPQEPRPRLLDEQELAQASDQGGKAGRRGPGKPPGKLDLGLFHGFACSAMRSLPGWPRSVKAERPCPAEEFPDKGLARDLVPSAVAGNPYEDMLPPLAEPVPERDRKEGGHRAGVSDLHRAPIVKLPEPDVLGIAAALKQPVLRRGKSPACNPQSGARIGHL